MDHKGPTGPIMDAVVLFVQLSNWFPVCLGSLRPSAEFQACPLQLCCGVSAWNLAMCSSQVALYLSLLDFASRIDAT